MAACRMRSSEVILETFFIPSVDPKTKNRPTVYTLQTPPADMMMNNSHNGASLECRIARTRLYYTDTGGRSWIPLSAILLPDAAAVWSGSASAPRFRRSARLATYGWRVAIQPPFCRAETPPRQLVVRASRYASALVQLVAMATSVVACGLGVVAAARPAAAKKSGAPNQAAGLRRKLVPGQAFNGVPLRLSAQSSRASRAAARRSHTPTAAAVAAAPEQDGKGPFVPWEGKLANKFRRTDIKRILILGAGPIVIGQVKN